MGQKSGPLHASDNNFTTLELDFTQYVSAPAILSKRKILKDAQSCIEIFLGSEDGKLRCEDSAITRNVPLHVLRRSCTHIMHLRNRRLFTLQIDYNESRYILTAYFLLLAALANCMRSERS